MGEEEAEVEAVVAERRSDRDTFRWKTIDR